jgi:hypothetical protein
LCRGSECGKTRFFAILGGENSERAVTDQLQYISAMIVHSGDDDLGIVAE